MLKRSRLRPISNIVKIWFRTEANENTTIRAVIIAMMEVIVIVVPVLNAPKSAELTLSFFFRSLVVRSMSVSTE